MIAGFLSINDTGHSIQKAESTWRPTQIQECKLYTKNLILIRRLMD